jgi:dihydroflavonol-4-reductase
VPAVIVQPSAPVGPGDRGPTPPGRLLQDLANGAVPAMPDCSWNLVDVRALADGVVAALDRGEPRQRYLLSGENMDTTGLLAVFEQVSGLAGPRARVPHGVALIAARVSEAVARGTGRPPQAPLTGVRLSGPRVCFDNAKARAGLGFVPGPIAPAIRDALVWMRSAGRLTRTLPGLPPE